jgi:hypothetical protein
VTFSFGQAGDLPVAGDWDGDGRDTIGVYRGGRWLLRNSLSAGPADLAFTYGDATKRPVVGDWNGDGVDSVGVFRNGTWSVLNASSAGPSSSVFTIGAAGDKPVVGEWDLDGRDEAGVPSRPMAAAQQPEHRSGVVELHLRRNDEPPGRLGLTSLSCRSGGRPTPAAAGRRRLRSWGECKFKRCLRLRCGCDCSDASRSRVSFLDLHPPARRSGC